MAEPSILPVTGPRVVSAFGRIADGRRFRICLGVVVLIALALRLPGLGERSFWLDEAYSAWFSALPLGELWTDAPRYETHPPLYYTLLKGWSALFGDSEAALRGLSTLASLATIVLMALAGRLLRLETRADRVALLAALLIAINPTSIVFALEARPYALQTLVVTGMVLAALRLFIVSREAPGSGEFRACLMPALVLGVTGGATLWLHNTGVFITFGLWAGLGIALLVSSRTRRPAGLAATILAGVVALIVWSPFLPTFLAQSRNVTATAFWVQAETRDLWSAWLLATGGQLPLTPVLLSVLLGLLAVGRDSKALAVIPACLLVLPLAMILVIHFGFRPVFVDRLFVWMTPILLGLAALGLLRGPGPILARLALTMLVAGSSLAGEREWPSDEDWRGLVAAIGAAARPGDRVIALPSEIDPAIGYYARRADDFPATIFVPGPFPFEADGRVYVGNLGAPRVEPSDVEKLAPALARPGRIWLVTRRADRYDPEEIVRQAIEAGRRRVSHVDIGPITVERFE